MIIVRASYPHCLAVLLLSLNELYSAYKDPAIYIYKYMKLMCVCGIKYCYVLNVYEVPIHGKCNKNL